jgi:CheY-like chemotaxis protein
MEPTLQAVEASIRERTDLLSVAGTEIRTPMNSIIGLTGLLLGTEVSGEQRGYLEGIKNSAESLLKIVNDILDFSKVKAGTLELESADFELRDTLANAVKTFARDARLKGLELVYEVRPDVPNALVGDPGRLWQIIVNLVGNAVKFTQHGEVSIKVETESSESEGAVLKFTVRDTGIGIPPDKQASLLHPVAQIGGPTTRKYSGAGLGLAISSRLVELMGGRIWFESEVGRGSEFHFTAKFALQAGPQWPEFPHPRLDGLNVLLVDDNDDSRRILKELLLEWRAVVTEANSGAAALAALRSAPWRTAHTSVVLLDAEMPEMNGFEVLEQIRREPEIDVLVVVLLNSVDESRDLDRCRFLAADAYVQKPVSPVELQDAIVAALRKSVLRADEHWRREAVRPSERRHRPLRILVAEDDRINQLFAVRLLEKEGHAVTAVANGEDALVAYRQKAFDLVLMDVQMPVMDGFEATVHIRQYERQTGVHTPIIAMTAWAEKEDRQRCLAAGMDGYVAKPIQTVELFAAMAAAIPDLLRPAGELQGAALPPLTVLQRTI